MIINIFIEKKIELKVIGYVLWGILTQKTWSQPAARELAQTHHCHYYTSFLDIIAPSSSLHRPGAADDLFTIRRTSFSCLLRSGYTFSDLCSDSSVTSFTCITAGKLNKRSSSIWWTNAGGEMHKPKWSCSEYLLTGHAQLLLLQMQTSSLWVGCPKLWLTPDTLT